LGSKGLEKTLDPGFRRDDEEWAGVTRGAFAGIFSSCSSCLLRGLRGDAFCFSFRLFFDCDHDFDFDFDE